MYIYYLDHIIERSHFMAVLEKIMRDPRKAHVVDPVHVLELLFDPDKLLFQLRSNNDDYEGLSG